MKRLAKLLSTVALAGLIGAAMTMQVQSAGLFQFPQGTSNAQTGNETIPMDSNLGSGINPATEIFSTQQLNLLGYVFVNANSAGTNILSWAVSNGIGTMLVSAPTTSTIQNLGISMPTTPVDGQTFYLSSNMSITTLNFSLPTGTSMNRSPTALTVSTVSPYGYKWLFRSADTTWYRLQ